MAINKKFFTKAYYERKFFARFGKYFPNAKYWYEAKMFYYGCTGKVLDYNNPRNINEKLMWLTRYWRNPLKTYCADKYLVREYVKEKGHEDILIPLLGVWDHANEIDFSSLPKKFVLKCNHGSGYNIICLDKGNLDVEQTVVKLNQWLSEDFSLLAHEIHYQAIPHKVICEELISETAPVEYQFWCLNGQPESMLVCRKNFNGTYDAASYSLDWERLYDRINEPVNCDFERPEYLDRLIQIAKELSKPFPFVRADFYVVDGVIYFAELTFTPAANILSAYKETFLDRLGRKLKLPSKYIP